MTADIHIRKGETERERRGERKRERGREKVDTRLEGVTNAHDNNLCLHFFEANKKISGKLRCVCYRRTHVNMWPANHNVRSSLKI